MFLWQKEKFFNLFFNSFEINVEQGGRQDTLASEPLIFFAEPPTILLLSFTTVRIGHTTYTIYKEYN